MSENSDPGENETKFLVSYASDCDKLKVKYTRKSNDKAKTNKKKDDKMGKELSLIHGVGLIVGSIIGSGIFISPNGVLQEAGSYGMALIMWIIGGLLAAGGGLCLCELGNFVKKSGCEYAYIKEGFSFNNRNHYVTVMGDMLSFLFTWTSTFCIRPMSIAVQMLTFGNYVVKPFFLECDVPEEIIKMASITAMGFLVMINCYSVKLAARVMVVLTMLKFLVAVFISALGIYEVSTGCNRHFQVFFDGSNFSPSQLSLALYASSWAYGGWHALNYGTEETHNVNKTLHRSMYIAIPFVIISYLLINLSYFAVLSVREITDATAVALPFGFKTIGNAGVIIISLSVAVSTLGSGNGNLFGGTRVTYVAARDGQLPLMFSGVHRHYKTPVQAVLLFAVLGIIMIIPSDIGQLINSFNAAAWIFYGLCFASLLIMRITRRKDHRPYKVFLPIPIFMLLAAILLVILPLIEEPVDSVAAFGIILLGIPVYFIFIFPYKCKPTMFFKANVWLGNFSNNLFDTTSSSYSEEDF